MSLWDFLKPNENKKNAPSMPKDRLAEDRQTVRQKFPENTTEVNIDGVPCWKYSLRCKFVNREYIFAAWYSQSDGEYQVSVLKPDIETITKQKGRAMSMHECHYIPKKGTICFRPPCNGETSLEAVYAKSVVWATGFSIYLETGKFPFSLNNEA